MMKVTATRRHTTPSLNPNLQHSRLGSSDQAVQPSTEPHPTGIYRGIVTMGEEGHKKRQNHNYGNLAGLSRAAANSQDARATLRY